MNMKKKIILLGLVTQLLLFANVDAQNMGINTTTPNASAILDVTSTTLGLLIPSTPTSTLPTTLAASAPGLLFYNTTTKVFNFNNSTNASPSWIPIISGATTNILTSLGNTLTSTVNGISSNVTEITAVGNSSSTNTLTSTINGVAGSGVNIINSNALSLSSTSLVSTVNGIGSNSLDLTPAINAVAYTLVGNATSSNSPFLGTTTQQDLIFKANSLEYMRISSATATPGYIGVGTAAPKSNLDVKGTFAPTYKLMTSTIIDNSASIFNFSDGGSNVITLTIPDPTLCKNRRYIIMNTTAKVKTISVSTFTISGNSSIELISDGSNWLKIFP